ncbi:MAG: NAD(P)-dependent oxidoreductase [Desulfurococcales archaeon]|nr:NAD(P)-dependent oxidoreductase [Desulfurococcales archaeon]
MGDKVSIIGTGRMGSAAAKRLAAKGYQLILWNRTKAKAEKLARELNAIVARSPFDAVQEARYAILFLADEDSVYSVLSTFHRLDGAVIINSATVTPHASTRFYEFVKSLGGCYVEAPVLGGPSAVEKGKALFVVSGERLCVNAAKPLLDDLAGEAIVVGEEPEKAAALKLAFNSLLIGNLQLLAEAALLSESYGVDASVFKEVLGKTVFASIVEKYLDRMKRDPHEPASFTLKLAMKDLDYAVRAGFYKGIAEPAISATLNTYRLAVKHGFSESDYTRIYHMLKGKD